MKEKEKSVDLAAASPIHKFRPIPVAVVIFAKKGYFRVNLMLI
jgi:hypothetical protein